MRTLVSALVVVPALALAAGPSLEERAKATFKPLSAQFDSKENPVTPEKVELGKALFFDARMSKNQKISCNSCHDVAKFGVDGEAFSTGHKGQKGGRNAPTVMNAGLHLAQFWDGRAATLEDQAKGPVLNPVEMATADAATAEKILRSIPGYAPMFAKAFPGEKEPVTFDNFAKAVGAYERTLATPSRFDAFLKGDAKALTDAEKAGLTAFMDTGCTACHMGEGVGGGMYQKFGLVSPVPGLKDEGRFAVTKKDADKFFFKVPSLRNIEKTAPYFHDSSAKTLEDAITVMAKHQLGKDLKKEEVASIATFLKALTGEAPKAALVAPKLPPSGPTTPKAQLD